jgi:DNA-binding response OmpR family regulator
MRILIVEDNKKTATLIAKALKKEGFEVDQIHRGNEVLPALQQTTYNAVVLDVMLPGQDGLSVMRDLRAAGNSTPVLLLSARGDVNDRVEGLNAGAEDYLPKPFSLSELIARIRALGRRGKEARVLMLRVGDLELDAVTHTATRAGVKIELTPREFRLLKFLMRSSGRVCSRMMIFQKVWDYDFDPGTNLIDVYIRKLREKMDEGFEEKLLHSIRHEGYLLKSEREEEGEK